DLTNCCLHVGLTDVRSIGCYYTWTNGSVWSKIDRAMVNDIWVQNGAYVDANFLPSGCLSDHSPCIVSIHDHVGSAKTPFKFFNIWTKHEDFHDLIQASWNFNMRGTKQFILCKKLSKLKEALKELNIKHFGCISDRVNMAKNELEAAQIQLHNQPMNENFQFMVAKLRKKALGLCEAEHCFYYHKAKRIFLKQSDKYTKFFHSVVKRNSMRNFIATILKEDGIYTTSQDQIKETLFGIEDDKSPNPDGYTSCLFKSAWRCIEHDFVEAIMEFFSSGSILKQINHAVIALVQNSSHNPSVGDDRPISCCNVICKVITKTLASRLRPILGDIVDQAQTAFIEGRSMMQNIHLAQELLRQYNRKRVASRCLLKIDIRKAYDLVSWDFLKSVLEGLNFPLRFIQ
ncbi:uncharacterized protein LOC111375367, partial [Olea europaea var. sylvestris]|uniref:uncharacterized protein LOC111375367 n=1 Tax=Olea europaea var. sylvestris TaxID=158386 RepID=UPI000C1D8B8E